MEANLSNAPFRDPRFAPRRLEVERRADGEMVLTNPTPYSTRFQTMTAPIAYWAKTAPNRVWLAERPQDGSGEPGDGWRTLTYGQAHEQIAAIAGGLLAIGVIRAEPLLILSGNSIDHALIAYAAMSHGMPVAPVSPQYGLRRADPSRMAHAAALLKPACVYTEDAQMFIDGLSAPGLAGLPVIASRNPRATDIAFDQLLAAHPDTAAAKPTEHAKYLLTSGSTGLPKAVVCTHLGIAANAAQIEACFDDPDPPVMVNSAPWSHSLGANSILHMCAHRGGTLYIDTGQPTALGFLETVRNLREISPTYHNMLPAGWMLLADELENDTKLAERFFEQVRLMQYGGAALGQPISDRIQAVAVRTVGERISFGSGYGATETGPTASNVHWTSSTMGLIGLPTPGTSVRLAPVDGKLDFRVKGPQLSPGYLGKRLPNANLDDEGYYIVGDAARLVDPDDPSAGLAFDGRLSENFKLVTGAFVAVGDLRIGAISAIGHAVTDAVVCGEGREGVGLLLYPNPRMPRGEVDVAVRRGLAIFNTQVRGPGQKVTRALVLPDGPSAGHGEITDKGYVAQSIARTRRADAVMRLFAPEPLADVIQL